MSFAVILVPAGISSASGSNSTVAAMPVPVQEALSLVEAYRGAGPLAITLTAGSVSAGIWTSSTEGQSIGVSQHWSFAAQDNSGVVAIGVLVTTAGTEDVSAWVPGSNSTNNWVFNSVNDAATNIYQVTVPASTYTVSEGTGSGQTQASPDSGPNAYCSGAAAIPYNSGPTIYYSGSVYCTDDAAISSNLELWDYYNSSTYEVVATTSSAGVEIDYPQGVASCVAGYAPRNAFHTEINVVIIWPPGGYPTETTFAVNSSPANLPCNQ